jgi:integrase
MNEMVLLESENHLPSHFQEMEELAELTKRVSANAKSPNTLNGYASDWEDFEMWCRQKRLQSLPAQAHIVAAYLSDRAINKWVGPSGRFSKPKEKLPLKLPTLLHRVWGIKFMHKQKGFFFDATCKEIEKVLQSLRRNNTAKEEQKDPLLLKDIKGMIETLPGTMTGIRDKAILLVGFTTAMRRSEIASLKMEDLKFVEEGIEVNLMQSKTGRRSPLIPYGSNPITCPVRALKAWLAKADINDGPIFRSINKHGHINSSALTGAAIVLIVKRNDYVKSKRDSAIKKGEYIPSYAGHSLRAGFCTHAAMVGVPEHLIMIQAGHKKSDTTKKYIRIANKWTENAAIKLGL